MKNITGLFILFFSVSVFSLELDSKQDILLQLPPKTLAITNQSPKFIIDLDYHQAFLVKIEDFISDNKEIDNFCKTYPSRIKYSIDSVNVLEISQGASSLDNIVFFNNNLFILDSITFDLIAIEETSLDRYTIIHSNVRPPNTEQYEEPFMTLDSERGRIFIVSTTDVLTYDLNKYFTAKSQGLPTPNITKSPHANVAKVETLFSVSYYKNHLYVAADHKMLIYNIDSSSGEASLIKTLDEAYFGLSTLSIVDMSFYSNFMVLLDSLHGLYTINLQNFELVTNSQIKLERGQFVQVVGKSLNVIASRGKSPMLYEYIISESTNEITFNLNRDSKIIDAVLDIYTDGNYLYILTGVLNRVYKHSIPGRFNSSEPINTHTLWLAYHAKALASKIQEDGSSIIYALAEGRLIKITFQEEDPRMECMMIDIPEGLYLFTLQAVQKTCEEKTRRQIDDDINTACVITEKINLIVSSQPLETQNKFKESDKVLTFLITLLLIISIILCIVAVNFKKKSRVLEERIKFKKLEEDSSIAEGTNRDDKSSKQKNPSEINIAVEMKNAEKDSKQKRERGITPLEFQEFSGKANKDSDDVDAL